MGNGGIIDKLLERVERKLLPKIEKKFEVADKRMARIEKDIAEIKEMLKRMQR